MTVGLVIVAHSRRLADGVREVAEQMAGGAVAIRAAGGAIDGSLGTNPDAIAHAIVEADSGSGVLVLMDLGSAVLSAETAVDMLGTGRCVLLSDAPLVEGAIVAAVEASIGQPLEAVAEAAMGAREMTKVVR
jgi:dihydroxyacetone kinase phosphotransfer subunit